MPLVHHILPSQFIISVYHPDLSSRFMPRNSWFVPHACPSHDQLPQDQVAILGNPEFWQRQKESQIKKEHPHNSHATYFKLFRALFYKSSVIIVDHRSHIDHYVQLPQSSTLQLLEIQTESPQLNWTDREYSRNKITCDFYLYLFCFYFFWAYSYP